MSRKLHNIQSIQEQTPWRCEFFDFGKAKNDKVEFFNPALVRIEGTLYLIARRSAMLPNVSFGLNDLVAFTLRGMQPIHGVKLKTEIRFPNEHFEDPRVILRPDGNPLVSCCNFTYARKKWSGAHQMIQEFTPDWTPVRRFDPTYGGNGANLGQNTGHEKNWLWFYHDGLPHLIYRGCPHEVIPFSEDFRPFKQPNDPRFLHGYKTEWDDSIWEFGEIRGGTPPIRIGDEYYTFFHSSTEWKSPKRQYHLSCYTFEAKPPFKVKRILLNPLLSGSTRDEWKPGKPPCVFGVGCLFENNNFIVSMGVNDLSSAWIEIPKKDIDEMLIDI